MIARGSPAVSLLASHFGIASSRLRDVLVPRLGGRGDLGSYSLVTLVAFAGRVAAYRRAPLDAGTVVLDEKGRTYPLEWVSLREPQFQRPVRRHCRRPSALRAGEIGWW